MRARTALTMLSVLLLSAAVFAQTADNQADPSAGARAEKPSVEQLLQHKLSPKFEDIPFQDVIPFLRDTTAANVFVDWAALEEAGIDRNSPVTLNLKNVPASSVLELVLDAVAGVTKLEYVVRDDVVVVSTAEALSHETLTSVYDVRDLIARPRSVRPTAADVPWRTTSFAPRSRTAEEVFLLASDSGLFADRPKQSAAPKMERMHEFVAMLKESIAPLSWRPAGETGSVEPLNGQLIITQTFRNHERVEQLFERLRDERRRRRVSMGLAVVRPGDTPAAEKLRELADAGGDVAKALARGVNNGVWTVDRQSVEDASLGEAVRVQSWYHRNVTDALVSENVVAELEQTTLTGYEIGLLAKARRQRGALSLSLACGSGWLPEDADPTADTPQKNAGTFGRHDVYEFTLAPGEAKVMRVIPADARGGEVLAVVWLPAE